MIKRINNYLLTHHPLIWNTRLVWLTLVCVIIHLLFLFAGLGAVSLTTLKDQYSVLSAGGTNVYMFSVLCSLAILILWMVYLLRNNAFKQFYVIEKYFLLKQFVICCFAIFLSISFTRSFQWGVRLRTRALVSEQQLVSEANTVNLAMSFVPVQKSDFFKLNNCDSGRNASSIYDDNTDYNDTTLSNYNDSLHVLVRSVINDRDAFSYLHYCKELVGLPGYANFRGVSAWSRTRDAWINGGRQDSIRLLLQQMLRIAHRYGIDVNINPARMAALVFADSSNAITKLVDTRYGTHDMPVTAGAGATVITNEYIEYGDFDRVFSFVNETRHGIVGSGDATWFLIVQGYIAICLAGLLLCYRMFSRRVFLISVIGAIVWSILFATVSIGGNNVNPGFSLLLLLFTGSLIVALLLLKGGSGKTTSGVLLNWHTYLLPFVVMMLMILVEDAYHDTPDSMAVKTVVANGQNDLEYQLYRQAIELQRQHDHPIGYWVSQHNELIIKLNLLFVFLYICFFITRLGRRWQIQPEE